MQNEGGDSWNSFEIIGHLIDCERVNWMPRAKFLLQHGVSKTFESFDRGGHLRETRGKSLDQLLDEFAGCRVPHISILRCGHRPKDDRTLTNPTYIAAGPPLPLALRNKVIET